MIRALVSVAGWGLAVLAAVLAVLSGLDAGARQSLAGRFAPDGSALLLEMRSAQEWLWAACALGLLAVLLTACRHRVASALASPPVGRVAPGRPTPMEAAGVLVVCVVAGLLAARNLDLPMRMDEGQTVAMFATQSAWGALADYSSNNNHVLHTLLVRLAYKLGGWDPAVLRLPAFAAAMATLPALWWFARREHGREAAVLGVSLVATSPLFVEYASNARGYSLMCLLWMVTLCLGGELVRKPERTALWALWALVLALGFLAIPVMAFPAAVTVFWMLLARASEDPAPAPGRLWRRIWRQRDFASRLATWAVAGLVLAAGFYLPALASDADALLSSPHMAGGSWLDAQWVRLWAWSTTLGLWLSWHAATPAWALVCLFALAAAGVWAPRRGTGRRGLLPAAVLAGMAVVFLFKPVILGVRMTLFLLMAAMMVAGAGAALLMESVRAGLGPGRVERRRRGLSSAVATAVVLACGAWWATRPGTTTWFAQETGFSPGAPALASALAPRLRSGDVVIACRPTGGFYLHAAGLRGLRPGADERFPKHCRAHAVGGATASERLFLIVDEAAHRASLATGRPRGLDVDVGTAKEMLDAAGLRHETVVHLPEGRVFQAQARSEGPAGQPSAAPARRGATP